MLIPFVLQNFVQFFLASLNVGVVFHSTEGSVEQLELVSNIKANLSKVCMLDANSNVSQLLMAKIGKAGE